MYVGTILQDSLKGMYRVPKVDDANELRRGDSLESLNSHR